ncbi:MAG: aminoacyl-tRNA hydrolase [Phycisphaeraceae bacterium]|nr:aminoacyl-tRNA hydrolase [Phycisphaeraceae bacterium]MCW5763687.1 aminoacyl-tRNA hydrolase [Phycisphaeraceae bacterium]
MNTPGTTPDDGLLELAPGVRVDPAMVRVDYVASSGPGGQNVNKRATKAQVRLRVTDLPIAEDARRRLIEQAGSRMTQAGELVIASDEFRSQRRNRESCLSRLRILLVTAMNPPRTRRATRTPRWAIERRIDEKKRQSDVKRSRRKPDHS